MRFNLFLLAVLCTALASYGLNAQSTRPADRVEATAAAASFEEAFQLFVPTKSHTSVEVLERSGADYRVFDLDPAGLDDLKSSAPATLQITLPGGGERLDLVKTRLFADGFRVTESGGGYTKTTYGLHYRGVVAGNKGSVVALSVFDDEVSGMIATEEGNFVLGKLAKSEGHVLYNDKDLPTPDLGECATPDSGIPYGHKELLDLDQLEKDANNCVNLYLEVDNSIYVQRGSNTANVTAFITGLFNQVATLYANENINLVLSELFVWSTADPYNSSSSTGNLTAFRNNRPSFNGDIAHLVSFQSSGGVAYVDVLCATPFAYGFSSINNGYQSVPSYSWSVNVLAHELGHNFGSQHTHACVWNGNGTALDACRSTEGGCSANVTLPSGGGTIMSYCHLTSTGVNFNKGFGTQPGNLMRNRAYNGGCLTTCSTGGGGGTGSGGGGTGGGGGGGTGCTDATTTITILTDNYPGETTWTLKNAAGATLASGGPYGSVGVSYTEQICLPDGCYTFEIRDAYGDGICCGWGNGAYTINVDGTDVATGGSFGSSKTENFCVSGSGGGGGDDGGGGGSGGDGDGGAGDDTSCDAISFNSYPPGSYGGTQDRGAVTLLNENTIMIQNNAWKAILLDYTVTPNTVIEFEFGSTRRAEIHGIGFDNNNSISSNRTFRLFGSQSWGLGNYANYTQLGVWRSYTIPVGQFYTGSFSRLFFVADHDGGTRDGNSYFRNIRIYEGAACTGLLVADKEPIEPGAAFGETTTPDDDLKVFPNPASDQINVELSNRLTGPAHLRLVDLRGRTVRQQSVNLREGTQLLQMTVGALPSGTYLLRVDAAGGYRATAKVTVSR